MILNEQHHQKDKPCRKFFFRSALSGMLLILFLSSGVFAQEQWRYHHPLPQGNHLNAVWAVSPNEVYFGGDGGVILKWNGIGWTEMPTPTTRNIYAIHGTSSSDIWAVGGDPYTMDPTRRSLILHYNGQTWREITAPDFQGNTYVFNAVHAITPNHAWATPPSGGIAAHWNGTRWEFDYIPLYVEGGLRAITSVGADHVFFVGTHGQILHRNQGTWSLELKTQEGGFTTDILQCIWAYDLETIYAGGNWGQLYRRNADGSWTDLGFPTDWFGEYAIQTIWGSSPQDIYLIGSDSIRHYDGVNPAVRRNFSGKIRTHWLQGSGIEGYLFLGGNAGLAHEYALDGSGGGVLSALTVGSRNGLGGLRILKTSPSVENQFFLFGMTHYTDAYPVYYFDGIELRQFPNLPPGMPQATTVRDILADGLNDLIIAWSGMFGDNPGLAHWDGISWSQLGSSPSNFPRQVVKLWKSPAGKLYACEQMQIRVFQDSNWVESLSYEQLPEGTLLSSLWGRNDQEIYAGTEQGFFYRFDGSTWRREDSPIETSIVGIAGYGNEVYAISMDGVILRRVSNAWQKISSGQEGEGDHFTAIATGADGVYATQITRTNIIGGGLGRVWKITGGNATPVVWGCSFNPTNLVVTGNQTVYILSEESSGISIMTTAPLPDSFTMQRVNTASTEWTAIGSTGIELRMPEPVPGSPVVAAWKQNKKSPLFQFGEQSQYRVAQQQWALFQEISFSGYQFPPAYLRLTYQDDLLPDGFDSSRAGLYQYVQNNWVASEADMDTTDKKVTSRSPLDLVTWSLAETQQQATPTPTATPTPEFSPTPTATPTPKKPDLELIAQHGIKLSPDDASLSDPFGFQVLVSYQGESQEVAVQLRLELIPLGNAVPGSFVTTTPVSLDSGSFSRWITLPDQLDPAGLTGTYALRATIDATQILDEANEDNNDGWMLLTINPQSEDTEPPTGSLSINSGAKTANGSTLSISMPASDDSGVVKSLYLRQWYLNRDGSWTLTWESGWIPYYAQEPNYPIHDSGCFYFEVFFADEAGNVSLPATALISVALPEDSLAEGEGVWFLLLLEAGEQLALDVHHEFGDCDLYAWYPGNLTPLPDVWSANEGTASERISFTAPEEGWYWIGLYADESSLFGLSFDSSTTGKALLSLESDSMGLRDAKRPDSFAPPADRQPQEPQTRIYSGLSEELDSRMMTLFGISRAWHFLPQHDDYDVRLNLDPASSRIDAGDLIRYRKTGAIPLRPVSTRP